MKMTRFLHGLKIRSQSKLITLTSQRTWRNHRDVDHNAASVQRDVTPIARREPCMMPIIRVVFLILTCVCCIAGASAADNPYLYKVTLVQAAPGKLLDLIDLYKSQAAELKQAGDEAPLWMRHSQGDHWDLMVLFPLGSYSDYYQPERTSKRQKAAQAGKLDEKFKELIAWQEDLFAYGPPLADLRKAFVAGAFFHVEMFISLPGKFADLY